MVQARDSVALRLILGFGAEARSCLQTLGLWP